MRSGCSNQFITFVQLEPAANTHSFEISTSVRPTHNRWCWLARYISFIIAFGSVLSVRAELSSKIEWTISKWNSHSWAAPAVNWTFALNWMDNHWKAQNAELRGLRKLCRSESSHMDIAGVRFHFDRCTAFLHCKLCERESVGFIHFSFQVYPFPLDESQRQRTWEMRIMMIGCELNRTIK